MKRPEEKGPCGVRAHGGMTSVETPAAELLSSAPDAKGVTTGDTLAEVLGSTPTPSAPDTKGRNNAAALAAPAATYADSSSAPAIAAKGISSSDTLSALHRDVTSALGLILATPGVPEALRASGRLDGARRVLHRHLELARARGAQ